ncbi:DUF4257 domain-containing protein [Pseudalkalibacillus caeni]|uniref:DUF4257 domain-containing protein n=1 Tax=Exobacillus caeni TaxID=2574798 RepID=A0A5R9F3P9_9BACL|nr:DUF4257 domain-containing protein [Pseudalkalibacillus caeni]TLS38312.1 DUF4257 domain-containing protein [Pseudalkalibacillus caeni]
MEEIWIRLIVSIGCGILGGIANLLNNEESFVMPRIFKDSNGNSRLLPGFLKELILGAIAGPLLAFPMNETLPWFNLITMSLIGGMGGSSILTALASRQLNRLKAEIEIEMNCFDVILDGPDSFPVNTANAKRSNERQCVLFTRKEMEEYSQLQESLGNASSTVEARSYRNQMKKMMNNAKNRVGGI